MRKISIFITATAVSLSLASCFGGGEGTNNEGSNNGSGTTTKSGSQSDIIQRADGSFIKLGGYKMASSSDAPMYKATLKGGNLPPKVDLRKYMTKVEDQGQIGSCTANATAGAYEYLLNRNQGVNNYDISRLFLYYNTRALDKV